jgi:hypothetical protein
MAAHNSAAVRAWVKQAELDAGDRSDGLTSDERDELAQLRRENRRLREDVEILKRDGFLRPQGDPVNVYPFIEAEKAQQHNVTRACQLMEVSRSACYAHRRGPSDRAALDAELTEQIIAVHEASAGTYGTPRIHAELRDQGRRHSRKRFARLLRARGGAAAPRGGGGPPRSPTRPRHRWRICSPATSVPPLRVNQRWCGDITYITTWEGWLYLPSSTSPHAGWLAGPPPSTCAPTWSPTLCPTRSRPGIRTLA